MFMRMRLVLLAPFALCVAASCSTASGTPTSVATDSGSPEAAPVDVPCEAPSISFAKSKTPYVVTLDHHVTLIREVAGKAYLYVLGGEQQDFSIVLSDIERAPIEIDGTLGAFESVGKIPRGRAGAALAVVGDDVVLIGGIVGEPRTEFTNETLVARFDATGRLDTWNAGPTLPEKVQHAAAVVIGRDVYTFGGTKGNAASKLAVRISVKSDGLLSEITPLTPLPKVRSHHTALVAQGAVYLAGGLDKGPLANPPSLSDVTRARLLPDGSLGEWEDAGAGLESPLSVAAVQQVGCSFLFPGGLDDSKTGPFTNRILRASITADGSFRPESPLESKLSVKRGHVHQTPVYKQFLYSVGGRSNDGSTVADIDIGTIK
jgi:hypothetical protein